MNTTAIASTRSLGQGEMLRIDFGEGLAVTISVLAVIENRARFSVASEGFSFNSFRISAASSLESDMELDRQQFEATSRCIFGEISRFEIRIKEIKDNQVSLLVQTDARVLV